MTAADEAGDDLTRQLTAALAAGIAGLAKPLVQAAVFASQPGKVPKTPALQQFSTRLVSIDRPTTHLALLRFELPATMAYTFAAGQFCYVFVRTAEGKERRPYSFASAPGEPYLDFAIKDVNEAGESGLLYHLEVGATIPISRALGTFSLRDCNRPAVFLATGTGVAPFRSMLLNEWSQGREPDVWLFLGARNPMALPYHEEFMKAVALHPNFHYVPVVSRPTPGQWNGAVGHVQDAFHQQFGLQIDLETYVCGVPAMVTDVVEALHLQGIPSQQIHVEKFV